MNCRCVVLIVMLATSVGVRVSYSQVDAPLSVGNSTSGDWPGFLGPDRNGKSAETGLITKWPVSGPPIVWQTAIGTSYAAPAIAGGRLYHFARFENAARLSCLDAKTGKEVWTCD